MNISYNKLTIELSSSAPKICESLSLLSLRRDIKSVFCQYGLLTFSRCKALNVSYPSQFWQKPDLIWQSVSQPNTFSCVWTMKYVWTTSDTVSDSDWMKWNLPTLFEKKNQFKVCFRSFCICYACTKFLWPLGTSRKGHWGRWKTGRKRSRSHYTILSHWIDSS